MRNEVILVAIRFLFNPYGSVNGTHRYSYVVCRFDPLGLPVLAHRSILLELP